MSVDGVYSIESLRRRLRAAPEGAQSRPGGTGHTGFAEILRSELSRQLAEYEQDPERGPDAGGVPGLDLQAAGAIELESVARAARSAAWRLRDRVAARLGASGLGPEEAVLTMDSDGRVVVANAAPCAEGAEMAFAADANLRHQFSLIAASANLVDAAREHMVFTGLYADAPASAAARLARRAAEPFRRRFHLGISARGVRVFFTSAYPPDA